MKLKLFFTSLVVAISCNSWASETVKGAKKDFAEFKQSMNTKLDKIEAELKELKASAGEKGHVAKEKTIKELEALRDDLRKKTEELNDDGSDAWKSFKEKLAKSADELNAKVQNALKKK